MTQEDVAIAYVFALLGLTVAGFVGVLFVKSTSIDRFKAYIIGKKFNWLMAVGWVVAGFVIMIATTMGANHVMKWEPPPPIKLILLDIDGVLNHNKAPERLNSSHLYDPACVKRLNTLIKKHKAKLVVCSAWRIGQTIDSMQGQLESIGVRGEVIGLTPWYQGYHTRDDEITAWLTHYGQLSDVESMVLIDDDSSVRFKNIQVKPNWDHFGLLSHHVDRASAILSGGLPENFDIGKVDVCESKASKGTNFGGHHIQRKLLDL